MDRGDRVALRDQKLIRGTAYNNNRFIKFKIP
jgi:hypothetical protein